MSVDLGPAVADLLGQLGGPFDGSRRLLVEAHPNREHEVRVALGKLPEGIRDMVDLRFPDDYPSDSIGVRPVYPPQWHVVPRVLVYPDTPSSSWETPERALLRRILRDSGAEVFAEPGGQPAWLSGGSLSTRLSTEDIALIEDVLR